MGAATLAQPSDIAVTAAAHTGLPVARWQDAVDGAGGPRRAAWLLANAGQPLHRMTPEALLVAHVAAVLLDLAPRAGELHLTS